MRTNRINVVVDVMQNFATYPLLLQYALSFVLIHLQLRDVGRKKIQKRTCHFFRPSG